MSTNYNISAFGSVLSIVASNTFPAGVAITSFAGDVDPVEQASVKIGDVEMGVNGDMQSWRRAVALPVTIGVIPGSQDDINLSTIASNNLAVQGRSPANDTITLTVTYPDGSIVTLSNGVITDAPFLKSMSSAGRLKTNSYTFMFQGQTGSA